MDRPEIGVGPKLAIGLVNGQLALANFADELLDGDDVVDVRRFAVVDKGIGARRANAVLHRHQPRSLDREPGALRAQPVRMRAAQDRPEETFVEIKFGLHGARCGPGRAATEPRSYLINALAGDDRARRPRARPRGPLQGALMRHPGCMGICMARIRNAAVTHCFSNDCRG